MVIQNAIALIRTLLGVCLIHEAQNEQRSRWQVQLDEIWMSPKDEKLTLTTLEAFDRILAFFNIFFFKKKIK